MSLTSSVKVGVRSRPLSSKEISEGSTVCIQFSTNKAREVILDEKTFTFDYVFNDKHTQEQIYKPAISDMIDSLFVGYNVTVLAYGQTGSGKTYTMDTNFNKSEVTFESGIIPRAVEQIFQYLDGIKNTANTTVKVSFIEVYNEDVYDLLSREKEIRQIREENQNLKMPGLVEEIVTSADDIFRCLSKGSRNRAVGSTLMNETSSRSHALFTINISIMTYSNDENMLPITVKLNLVDLAGSERAGKTGATGDQLKEGANINKGLLELGNVIQALVKKSPHIPYRNSNLTRLLQDSLGGNTKTLMLACLSPASSNFDETKGTLNYAAHARNIKNKPKVNRVYSDDETKRLKEEIAELKRELHKYTKGGCVPVDTSDIAKEVSDLRTQLKERDRKDAADIERISILYDIDRMKRDDFLKNLLAKFHNPDESEDAIKLLKKTVDDIVEHENHMDIDGSNEDDIKSLSVNTNSSELIMLTREFASNKEKLENAEEELRKLQDYVGKIRVLERRIKELEEEQLHNNVIQRRDELDKVIKDERNKLMELNRLKTEKDKKTEEAGKLKQTVQELRLKINQVTKSLTKERDDYKRAVQSKDRQCRALEGKDRQNQLKIEQLNTQFALQKASYTQRLEKLANSEKRLKGALQLNKRDQAQSRGIRMNQNSSITINKWIKAVCTTVVDTFDVKQSIDVLINQRTEKSQLLRDIETSGSSEEADQVRTQIHQTTRLIDELKAKQISDSYFDNTVDMLLKRLRMSKDHQMALKVVVRRMVQEMNKAMEASAQHRNESLRLRDEIELLKSTNEQLKVKLQTARRRTSMHFNDGGPETKIQKFTDTDSVVSCESRLSSRLSQSNRCRCSSRLGCQPNRCGCLKKRGQCTIDCNCNGNCSDRQRPKLSDITEMLIDDNKENQNVDEIVGMIISDDSFTVIDNNQTIVNTPVKTNLLNTTYTKSPIDDFQLPRKLIGQYDRVSQVFSD